MWRPGKAVVPHRHEEPASYRPTTTARKHGPLQSRTGRQIRDVDRVRHAGEPVAVALARDRHTAEDALEHWKNDND